MRDEVDVKNWMSGDPVAVASDAAALEALDLMLAHGIRHLPVLNPERRVVGVLSVDDLRAALPFSVHLDSPPEPRERELALEWSVAEVMTHAPETVLEESSLSTAAQRMATLRIGCLPVVDANGGLVGMLSETDVLHALATTLWTDEVRERREGSGELEELAVSFERERVAIVERRRAEQRDPDVSDRFDLESVKRLGALERALERAAEGQLGVCEACRGAIPVARLRALPDTTVCVGCARSAPAR
jgi:CBS domain-containing protein/RNA polymerase-binding transcription factor DksA